jgi:hypothetical protein
MSCVHNTLYCFSLSLKLTWPLWFFFFFSVLGFLYLKNIYIMSFTVPKIPKKYVLGYRNSMVFMANTTRMRLIYFLFFSFFLQWIVFNYIHFIIKKVAVPLIPRPWHDGLTRRFINWGSNFGLKKI